MGLTALALRKKSPSIGIWKKGRGDFGPNEEQSNQQHETSQVSQDDIRQTRHDQDCHTDHGTQTSAKKGVDQDEPTSLRAIGFCTGHGV
jgi:hypothetical protein